MYNRLIYLFFVGLILILGIGPSIAYSDEGLIGYWRFDESSGTTAADSAGGDNDGTLSENTEWQPGYGQSGGALLFDGTSTAHVEFPTAGMSPATGTIAFWGYLSEPQPSQTRYFFGHTTQPSYNNRIQLYMDGGNTELDLGLGDSHTRLTNIMVLETETWYHVALTWDNGAYVVYVNGEEAARGAYSGLTTLHDFAWIGNDGNPVSEGTEAFGGMLDEFRLYDRALTADQILAAMEDFLSPELASNPIPGDEAADVSRDVILGWKPGEFANTHDVYLGTVFDDVNDADRTNPLDVLLSQDQDANNFEPGRLELGQMYYWRVDEVNAPPDSTIFKGDTWSFMVESIGYPIPSERITVTASSTDATKRPENTVDGSGLDESGLLHSSIGDGNMWLSGQGGQQPTWIQYEFDKVYKLHEMWVWNFNEGLEPVLGLGFKDVTVEYSEDGTDFTSLGTTHEFAQASGDSDYAHNTTIDFGGVAVKFVKLTANSNWGGLLNQYGLSEVRFFQIPVHAKEPSPDSGATDVALEIPLSWRAGREAAVHNVYFSDDMQTVIDGTADVSTVTDTSYGPLSLDLGKTYYWRVDEVNNAEAPSVWEGNLWDFTTHEYFVVDDFEDYNDYEPDRIFDTWVDGWGIDENGATAGYPNPSFPDGEHFAETAIVHSGSQAMPYFYDNSAGYSEATLTLSSLRNWAEKGISRLVLWFRGNPTGLVEDPAGTYTINATGADIWETADEFRYVFKQLSGPGSIIARVESLEDTDDWAKAGVMIRQTLDPGSKFAAVYITPVNGCRFQARLTIAGNATADDSVATAEQMAITAPYWVKIERDASNNFNGYYSSDGVNWTAMSWNPRNTAMPADIYIGLALTSHNSGVTCTSVFSNVQTVGTVTPQAWMQKAIGVEMPSNDAAQMYVVLNGSAVVYNDNPNTSQIDEWTEWNIDLQEFADQGVDLTNVDTLGIGFGDRSNPQPGGSGVVYFDDIRLYPLLPEPEPEPEPAL